MSDASPVLLTPDVVGGLAGKRVLVVGDIMLDAYLIGDADRISPEAPVPVVRIEKERYLLGGAAKMGLMGVWVAMYIDWLVRSIVFTIRFARGKWKELRVI